MNVAALSDEEVLGLYYDWDLWARPSQKVPDGDWLTWLLLAGRGFGKTRVGAEWIRHGAENGCRRMALVGATAADVRDTMVEGESGVLAVSSPSFMPIYEPSKRRITWPNGAMAVCFTADEPNRLRGPQHDRAWCDELAAWRYPDDAWNMLMFGLRIGRDPRVVVTTTPRPISLLREMVKDPTVRVTTGSTYENTDNLAPAFKRRILSKYEGTTIGRQELYAELFSEAPGALWRRADMLDAHRVKEAPEFRRIAVAVDPSVTSTKNSDEAGIVWGGLGVDGHAYVCGDLSLRASPDTWVRKAVNCYNMHEANELVYESNQGGDLVKSLMRTVDKTVAIRGVHASRGKYLRAEPVSALYEQGLVHHVGMFPSLEDEMCNWLPGSPESPNRLDACVYLVTALAPWDTYGDMNLDVGEKKREMP